VKNISLSVRLTFWFSAIFLAGFIAFGVAMWADLSVSLSQGRDRTLARRAARLEELLKTEAGDSIPSRALRYAEFAEATPEGNLIHLLDAQGRRVLPQNPEPVDFSWPPFSGFDRRYRDTIYDGRHFRVFVEPIQVAGERYFILVAGQLEDNRGLLSRFSTGLLASIPGVLSISALAGCFLSRRALRPIDRLATAVRSITIGNLAGRLPISNSGDELQRLAETCNDMLARLEGSIGRIQRFTADASHELRSPISFMRAVAEMGLGNPVIDPESRESFEEILLEATAASNLLENMLELARADSGRQELQFERLDLSELIDELRARALPLADAKQQTLAIDGNVSTRISGDRASLRRLVWTLLDNAIKYTPCGGRIDLLVDAAANETTLEVRDTGIGIPAPLLPRVFERFFRADPSRAQVEGAGLGLAIAKWIADMHRASISVESVEGRGTTFRVVFPAAGRLDD
jgi:heavy metal sensor kinase